MAKKKTKRAPRKKATKTAAKKKKRVARKKKKRKKREDSETQLSARHRWMAESRELGRAVGVAILVAVVIRLFVVEAYKIRSGSMLPTLEVGDHIFVNKFVYGLMVPMTTRKILRGVPEVGDVIVFKYPRDKRESYLKRVVALPGDSVEVIGGYLYVNGDKYDIDSAEKGSVVEQNCRVVKGHKKIEHLHEVDHSVFDSGYTPKDDFGAVRVPDEHVFVMGDNRDESLDSREGWFVPLSHIKGKAMFIWLSRNRCTQECPGGADCKSVRWGRILRGVH